MVKLKKSQIKELIRHTIVDLTEKTFGSKAQYDAYRKKHNLKPGSKHKVDGKTVTVRDVKKISKSAAKSADKFAAAQNAKLDAAEKAAKKKVKESKMRRFTVKEVRMWMKKLEENRYKKVYNSDARRVAWMVNNEGRTLDEMPMSMKKKWTKAQYGRERYLANEFIKSKSEQMTEGKLSEGFKKIALKKVKYKTKMSGTVFSFDWEIESGIDTDVMGGNTPKIILHYVRTELEGEYKGDKISGGNTFWLKHKDGKPYTPQEAKKLVNKISNKNIGDFHKKSQNPSGSGQHIYYQDGKFLREGKLTSEQKLRQTIREIIKEQMNEAITGSDRKILFILVREIVRNLKSKIKNFDVNNKSHMNRVGSSILAIIRAMSYSPDNMNYKNFKKYFPKNFNSKLIQKKLKQFHSQTDKVQMTLVTQAIKNELGAGVNEAVRASVARFLYIPKKDIKKAIKVVKSMPMNLKGKVEIEKKPSDKVKGFYAITTEKQLFNAVVEFLATAGIGVKTISQGKM